MPAPPMPMQAMPAPMYFAAIGSMSKTPLCSVAGRRRAVGSMARVKRVVEIDAGENGEHVGLQECHEQLERGERNDHEERQRGAEPAEEARGAEHRHEGAEHLQRDVA